MDVVILAIPPFIVSQLHLLKVKRLVCLWCSLSVWNVIQRRLHD